MFFVEPGFKVNGAYYRDVLLKQQMLPDIRCMSGDSSKCSNDIDSYITCSQ